MKKTLILGASASERRYSYLAAQRLLAAGHEIVLVGKEGEEVFEHPIHHEFIQANDIDTVTLYLNPKNQEAYYQDIIKLNPKRVIFNPGTENTVLAQKLEKAGIAYEYSCTLVMLSAGIY